MGVEFGGLFKEIEYKVVEEVVRQKGKGMWFFEKGGGFFYLSKKVWVIESLMVYKR